MSISLTQKKPLLDLSSLSMLGEQVKVKASEWLKEESSASFDCWRKAAQHQTMSKEDIHRYKLMQKYAGIWRMKTQKGIIYFTVYDATEILLEHIYNIHLMY